jgi:hypothetical protein
MAKFKKRLKNGRIVEFDIATYEELTGSAEFNARRRLISNKQRIPYQLQRGDQSKGFKKADIQPIVSPVTAPQIIKLDENLNYVALPRQNYTSSLFRKVSESIAAHDIKRIAKGKPPMPASLFESIRSRIDERAVQLPPVIMYLVEDTPFTGSYNIKTGSIYDEKFAYSGIANIHGYMDRTINNDSPTATGATWSFANSESRGQWPLTGRGTSGNEWHQSEYTASFTVRTYASSSVSGSFISTVGTYGAGMHWLFNPFTATSSYGARVDIGKFYNYKYHTPSASNTGSVENISTAGYYQTVLKANIFGDGNETLFSASFNDSASAMYAADRELLTFPNNTVVASGNFWHCDKFEVLVGAMTPTALAYRPIKRTTLYWVSGSGGLLGTTGLSGSISPNQILPDSDSMTGIESGSHIFVDVRLTQPASGGYYTISTPTPYPATFSPQNPNSHGVYWTDAADLLQGGLATGGVIHIAGRGINDYTKFGEEYFDTPFINAHDQTVREIPAACRWNGMSFTAGKDTGELSPGDYDDTGDN